MPKAIVDWEAIERDYRTGRFTLRELQDKYGPTASTIMRRAKSRNWQMDLSEVVRQTTKAKLLRDAADKERADQAQHLQLKAQQAVAEVVDLAAEENASVVRRHRTDISKAREITLSLLGELRAMTVHADDLERLLELAQSEDMTEEQVERMREDFRKLMSMGGRTSSLQKLADTMTKLQALERKAFDLDAPQEEKKGDPLSELMGFLQGGAAKLKPGAQ